MSTLMNGVEGKESKEKIESDEISKCFCKNCFEKYIKGKNYIPSLKMCGFALESGTCYSALTSSIFSNTNDRCVTKKIDKNKKLAYKFYRNTPDKEKDSEIIYKMGEMFYIGEGVKQDFKLAHDWFMKSINQFSTHLILGLLKEVGPFYRLGEIYYQGKGVEKDLKKACEFFIQAHLLHKVDATKDIYKIIKEYYCTLTQEVINEIDNELVYQYFVNTLITRMQWPPSDEERGSYSWLDRSGLEERNRLAKNYDNALATCIVSAISNEVPAQYCLANVLMDRGKERRKDESLKFNHEKFSMILYHKAAVGGHVVAAYLLAKLHEQQGNKENLQKACVWFEKASANGHLQAIYDLACGYLYGTYGERDYKKAYEYFQMLLIETTNESLVSLIKKNFGNVIDIRSGVNDFCNRIFMAREKTAEMLYKGLGVHQDFQASFHMLSSVITSSNYNYVLSTKSKFLLGCMYFNGCGTNQDYYAAYNSFIKIMVTNSHGEVWSLPIDLRRKYQHSWHTSDGSVEDTIPSRLKLARESIAYHRFFKSKDGFDKEVEIRIQKKRGDFDKVLAYIARDIILLIESCFQLFDCGNLSLKEIRDLGLEKYIDRCTIPYVKMVNQLEKLQRSTLEPQELVRICETLLKQVLICVKAPNDPVCAIRLLEYFVKYHSPLQACLFMELASIYEKEGKNSPSNLVTALNGYVQVIHLTTDAELRIKAAQQIPLLLKKAPETYQLDIKSISSSDQKFQQIMLEIQQQLKVNSEIFQTTQTLNKLLKNLKNYEQREQISRNSLQAAIKDYQDIQLQCSVLMENLKSFEHVLYLFEQYQEFIRLSTSSVEYNFGVLYQEGFSVKKDPSEAQKWFTRAASKGHLLATQMLSALAPIGGLQEHAKVISQQTAAIETQSKVLQAHGQAIQNQTTAISDHAHAVNDQTQAIVAQTKAMISSLALQQKSIKAADRELKIQAQNLKISLNQQLKVEIDLLADELKNKVEFSRQELEEELQKNTQHTLGVSHSIHASMEELRAELKKKQEKFEQQYEANKKSLSDQLSQETQKYQQALEKETKARQDQILRLDQEITSLSDALQKGSCDREKLESLTKAQALLLEKYNYDKGLFEEQQRMKQEQELMKDEEPSRYRFYIVLRFKLRATFHGYQTLASDVVERSKNTSLDKVGTVINFAGEAVPIPYASKIAEGLTSLFGRIVDKRVSKTADKVANLTPTYAELDAIVECTAVGLAERYQEQLKVITEDGAAKLAQYAIKYIMAYIGQVTAQQLQRELVEQFVHAPAMGALNKSVKSIFSLKKEVISTVNKKYNNWNYEGILQRAGIKISTGTIPEYRFFCCEGQRPDKYLYRLGNNFELRNAEETILPIISEAETKRVQEKLKLSPKIAQMFQVSPENQNISVRAPAANLSLLQSKVNVTGPNIGVLVTSEDDPRLTLQRLKTEFAQMQTQMQNTLQDFGSRLAEYERRVNLEGEGNLVNNSIGSGPQKTILFNNSMQNTLNLTSAGTLYPDQNNFQNYRPVAKFPTSS